MGNVSEQFEECLKKGHIRIFDEAEMLIKKELKAARDDLRAAKESLEEKRWKWSTIQAYYVMFHTARSLLFAKGYRERQHRCLRIAVAHLYAKEGEVFSRFIDDFQLAKQMRENADYESDFSELGARKLVKRAEAFLAYAKKLMKPV
ncbi:MAG: hypothetical protein COX62_02085 [Deltaproteobacteria bacterium CG_4_10_14_0_2_um_filter_43_8]|nr:MAG: hypothetical protein COV43_04085 [Deltaproteobacteria bacterium CG11_big_fil_rev_8_21_14_0_20_42_23]PJA21565.1 MAG: hypothetical protein COX62_02085 [Deltaproteobacteria bacterium CG_4_10_14_0_2_um_filter_43_8]PJC64899.1 MAG: hypothetical protein CO021_01970 [Deltaproteobacteria bacterium CG_4_9_14_0_2_um_filter_42_21]